MICKKEKSIFLFESNKKQTNILILYTLNFGLFFIIGANYLFNNFSSIQPQKQNNSIHRTKEKIEKSFLNKHNKDNEIKNDIFEKNYFEDFNLNTQKKSQSVKLNFSHIKN